MGKEADAIWRARRNVHHWANARVDAVIITASGCGTTIKDYGFMLARSRLCGEGRGHRAKARTLSSLPASAASSFVSLRVTTIRPVPCSMASRWGQGANILRNAGFTVQIFRKASLLRLTGYNIMQPEIATQLRDRKIKNIKTTNPQVIATGNIGCITQLATDCRLHSQVELLDCLAGQSPTR
jgi:glycolate oxidase iron-sulfur subunit